MVSSRAANRRKVLKFRQRKRLLFRKYYKLQNDDESSTIHVLSEVENALGYRFQGMLNFADGENDWEQIEGIGVINFNIRRFNNPFTDRLMKEIFWIHDEDGDICSADTVYPDQDGTTNVTVLPTSLYGVNNGTGKYQHVDVVKIFFDNDGTQLGDGSKKFIRQMDFYTNQDTLVLKKKR